MWTWAYFSKDQSFKSVPEDRFSQGEKTPGFSAQVKNENFSNRLEWLETKRPKWGKKGNIYSFKWKLIELELKAPRYCALAYFSLGLPLSLTSFSHVDVGHILPLTKYPCPTKSISQTGILDWGPKNLFNFTYKSGQTERIQTSDMWYVKICNNNFNTYTILSVNLGHRCTNSDLLSTVDLLFLSCLYGFGLLQHRTCLLHE